MKLTDEELSMLSSLAHKQVSLEAEVAQAEEALDHLKKALNLVKQVELPNLMAELNVSIIGLLSGEKVEVKQKYYASIPVERKHEAFTWLEENKMDGIIKNVVKAEFGKGENALAKKAMQELVSLGFQPTQDMSVHPMTLKAFVKDLYERGVDFPADVFGAFTVNESKVILPK